LITFRCERNTLSGLVSALTVNISCTLIDENAPTNKFECPLPTALSGACRSEALCNGDGFAVGPSTQDGGFAFGPSFDSEDTGVSSSSVAAVIGGAGGGVLLALLLIVALFICVAVIAVRRKRARMRASNDRKPRATDESSTSRRAANSPTEYADLSTVVRRQGGDGYEVGTIATADEYDSTPVAQTRHSDYGHGDLAAADNDYDSAVVAQARGNAYEVADLAI